MTDKCLAAMDELATCRRAKPARNLKCSATTLGFLRKKFGFVDSECDPDPDSRDILWYLTPDGREILSQERSF